MNWDDSTILEAAILWTPLFWTINSQPSTALSITKWWPLNHLQLWSQVPTATSFLHHVYPLFQIQIQILNILLHGYVHPLGFGQVEITLWAGDFHSFLSRYVCILRKLTLFLHDCVLQTLWKKPLARILCLVRSRCGNTKNSWECMREEKKLEVKAIITI